MSLLDLIETSATPGALQQIAARIGLPPEQARNVIASILPTLAPKLAEHADNGNLERSTAASAPPTPGTDEATAHGNVVLGSIFGSKDVSRSVAADASAQTGVGVDKIKAMLPQLASLAAAAFLAHRAGSPGGDRLGGLFSSVEKGFGLT